MFICRSPYGRIQQLTCAVRSPTKTTLKDTLRYANDARFNTRRSNHDDDLSAHQVYYAHSQYLVALVKQEAGMSLT